MGHAVERFGGVTEELGGRAISRVGIFLRNERLEAEGRVLQERGRAMREAADAADREKGVHAVETRIDEVFGTEEEGAEQERRA